VSLGRHPSRDLLLVVLLALVGALAALLPLPSWLQFILLAPLALVLPGYALSSALFPPGTLAPLERCVYVFVFSLSVAAIGGMVVQLALALDRTAWVLLELAATLAAVAIALRRRALLPIQLRGEGSPSPSGRRRRAGFGPGAVIALAGAAALAIFAVATASDGVHEQRARQVFVSLWALPGEAAAGQLAPVRVGIWNHGAPSAYRLQVSAAEQVLAQIPVRLGSRQKWKKTLPPPPDAATGDLELTLFHGSRPYRSIVLNIGEGG
jgi:hypothetical protein